MKKRHVATQDKRDTPLLEAIPEVAHGLKMTEEELLTLCVFIALGPKRINNSGKTRVFA